MEFDLNKKMTTTQRITDDLEAMLAVFPPELAQAVQSKDSFDDLLEVILDLGRNPSARFTTGEVELRGEPVTQDDLKYVTDRISDFDADNRAGLERTLHRISAIRNRRGKVVGLTCRIGRAVYGTIEIIEEPGQVGQSILILGKPIGKPPCCAKPPGPWRKNTVWSSWILPMKSAGTAMCLTRRLDRLAACRCPSLPFSMK